MRVVVLGKGLMLANIILGLKDAGADIVGVLRYEKTCNNHFILKIKDFFTPTNEVTLLKQLNIRELNFKTVNSNSFRKFLIKNNIDMIIVGTWKEKISKETFDIPTIGTVNVHPSLLPKYRGPNPYIQTILHGETKSGVTLHLIDENYDTGAILAQDELNILPTDTSKELRERTVILARKLVYELLTDLDTKIITPIIQSEKHATYFPNITGDEKMLNFKTQSSEEITRTVRALHPFLPCYITINKKFLIVNPYSIEIINNEILANPEDIIDKNPEKLSLTIVCKDNKAIKFSRLKLYKHKHFTKNFIKKIKITCEK